MSEIDYIAQLRKKYPDFLRRVIAGEPFETISLRGGLKMPENTVALFELTASFQQYEKANGRLGWTIDWKDTKTKKFGKQRWPSSVKVTTEEDFLFLIGKGKEVVFFRSILQLLVSWNGGITRWLLDHPLDVLKYADDWKDITIVVDFFLSEDASAYYIRNLPIPVHTKFIDKYAYLILSILQLFDPEKFPPTIDDLETAAGLRKKPHLFPIRWLDGMLAQKYTAGLDVLALPFTTLQNAGWIVEELWVVENETNLYLVPERKNALALFAKGYALHRLKDIPFFASARVFYWGDLDEDGYIMLEQFRRFYPHAISLLMDEKTVRHHIDQIRSIHYRYNRPILELHPEELAGYCILLEKQGRIEQEKLQQDFVRHTIEQNS